MVLWRASYGEPTGSHGHLIPTLRYNKVKPMAIVFHNLSSGCWHLHDKKNFLAFKEKMGQDCSPVVEYLPTMAKTLGLISQNWKMMDILASENV